MSGLEPVALPLAVFEARGWRPGDRFYVRAFAETSSHDATGCVSSDLMRRKGACIRHYAFSNPIWAITKTRSDGVCPQSSRALDRDGDGLPDGCDRCPNNAGPCVVPGGSSATLR